MKKLLSALLAICMVCMFAVPVFADANDDYIAAVKAYQQEIAAKEAAYVAAVDAYSKQARQRPTQTAPPSWQLPKPPRPRPMRTAWL